MQYNAQTYRIEQPGRFGTVMLAVGLLALAVSLIGLFTNADQFFYSYLVALTFWITISLGGLFMVMVHHLTGATWSVVLRRIGEAVMMTLPVMAALALPLVFGATHLFKWADPEVMAYDEILQAKQGYLNVGFFAVRVVLYFVVFSLLALLLRRASVAQDDGWKSDVAKRYQRIAAPGMIAYALAVTFSCFDWVMSLEPHWYSTIYGLWYFAGGIMSMMAFYALAVNSLHKRGVLTGEITNEHRHDIGKLMFAFMVFWGYMHLSQYLLIWYANLPEETLFYKMRWVGTWRELSLFLAIGGFTVPFVLLMGRGPKRSPLSLGLFAVWLLLVHYVDLYWNIMPNLHHEGVVYSWLDVTTWLGLGGVFLFTFWRAFTKHPVVPVTDPRLQASIHFVNH